MCQIENITAHFIYNYETLDVVSHSPILKYKAMLESNATGNHIVLGTVLYSQLY